MKIVIIGAGNAGRLLAKRLCSEERFSVVMVDPDEAALALAQESLDVMTVCGSGSDPAVLAQAETLAEEVAAHAGTEAPIRSVAPVTNRTRPGTEARRSPLAEAGQLFKNAPAVKGAYFKVASVLE